MTAATGAWDQKTRTMGLPGWQSIVWW